MAATYEELPGSPEAEPGREHRPTTRVIEEDGSVWNVRRVKGKAGALEAEKISDGRTTDETPPPDPERN